MSSPPAQRRPASFEVFGSWKYISDTNHILKASVSLAQSGGDVFHAPFNLPDNILGDCHGAVVEARGAGNEDPVAVNHGPRVTNLSLKPRS